MKHESKRKKKRRNENGRRKEGRKIHILGRKNINEEKPKD